uniref:Uncharacterized protein n=1 Tax=Arundo donax TaxID=35708 RepID=A0A0A9BM64_ARUDO
MVLFPEFNAVNGTKTLKYSY